MTTTAKSWTQESIEVAGANIQVVKGGSGDPLLVLHGEMGYHGWLRHHEALAQNNALHIPTHPGFGAAPRLDWIMSVRDLAGWYLEAIDDMGIGQANLMGSSLGGWLAAEMATMAPDMFKKLVLVAPAGIKPPTGEIFDMFLVVAREYMTKSVLDPASTPEFAVVCPEEATPEQVEAWEVAREESCRLTWRPYMHYLGLPHLLSRLKRLPTLIVWGREDAIIPVSAGEVYNQSIPGSRLEVIDGCGHNPEIEKSDEFVGIVQGFLSE